MLQRYDITMIDQTNRLSIKEFAVLETKTRSRDKYEPLKTDYSLIHEVSYDVDIIRSAIKEGSEALISELRSGDFFTIPDIINLRFHLGSAAQRVGIDANIFSNSRIDNHGWFLTP